MLAPRVTLVNAEEIRAAGGAGTSVRAPFRCHDGAGYLVQLGSRAPVRETTQPDPARRGDDGSPGGGDLDG